jgi:hypothetical protein
VEKSRQAGSTIMLEDDDLHRFMLRQLLINPSDVLFKSTWENRVAGFGIHMDSTDSGTPKHIC